MLKQCSNLQCDDAFLYVSILLFDGLSFASCCEGIEIEDTIWLQDVYVALTSSPSGGMDVDDVLSEQRPQ